MISTRISTKRCSKCLWRRERSRTRWDRSSLPDICSSSACFVLARLACLWRLRRRSNKGCSIYYIICCLFVLHTMFVCGSHDVCLLMFFWWKGWFEDPGCYVFYRKEFNNCHSSVPLIDHSTQKTRFQKTNQITLFPRGRISINIYAYATRVEAVAELLAIKPETRVTYYFQVGGSCSVRL